MKNKLFTFLSLTLLTTLIHQPSTVFAATRTWDGGGTNNNWTTATNWVGDTSPVVGDDLVFPSGAERLVNTNNFSAGTTFNAITISGTNYDVSGSAIALNAGINATNTTLANFWSVPLSLNSNQTITTGNDSVNLYLSGALNLNNKDLTFAGDGFAQVNSVISGTGGLIKTGNGGALLYANNSFSGGVQLLQGTISIYDDSALGTTSGNTTVAAGAALNLAGERTIGEPLVLSGTLNSSGFGGKVLTGPISLADPNATIQVGSSAPMSINNVISGSGGLTKTFSGVLTLNSNNTYTGITTVSAGDLLVNGSQPGSPIVLTAGTLSGTGTVGTITSTDGSTKIISPGGNPGILNSSNVTFNSTTAFAIELNGTNVGSGYDQLNVSGTVALGSALLLVSAPGLALAGSESFVIINNDGTDAVSGTFNGLSEGAIVAAGTNSLKISYAGGTGNDVVLFSTNAPPPPACLMLWTNRYIGPGGPGGEDNAKAIGVDDSGNVFVSGSSRNGSNFDYLTLAYTSAGVPLWTNRYNGPGNSNDFANALAVGDGSVFVTGSSVSGSGYADYATVAYSSAGVPLWTNRYNGPGNTNDVANSLALDNTGRVIVTGGSLGSSAATSSDYATVAYSSAGAPLWTNRYNGPAGGFDEAKAVGVNGAGDVFVTGFSTLSGGNRDYATLAYSSVGVALWTNRYNGPGNNTDEANALKVAGNGNVFVTGLSLDGGFFSDYATVAYSGAGAPLWTNRYNGPDNKDDYANALAVDNGGNVFVTGFSSGSTSDDYVTLAYSGAGAPLWTNSYNGPVNNNDYANALAVDSGGNVFVTGHSWGGTSLNDYATVAYLGTGVPLWTNRYNGPDNNNDYANALAVDSGGFVYVTGQAYSPADEMDYATIKYPSSVSPYLSIRASGGQLVFNWLNACYDLQSAPIITGTFTNVSGATSPHTNSITGAQQYYRLKKN